jgi:hypothetical protein
MGTKLNKRLTTFRSARCGRALVRAGVGKGLSRRPTDGKWPQFATTRQAQSDSAHTHDGGHYGRGVLRVPLSAKLGLH